MRSAAVLVLFLFHAGEALADSGLYYDFTTRFIGSEPEAVAIADLNGDGRNDVVMTIDSYFDPENVYRLFVFLQQPSGQLAPPVKYPAGNGQSVGAGDINGDGRADVVVTHDRGIGVFLQTASGGLAPMITYGPKRPDSTTRTLAVRLADFNSDGRVDVASLESMGGPVKIYSQNAGGTLDAPVPYPVLHGGGDDLETGDVNHDGRTDILVMSGQGYAHNFAVLLQQPGGVFSAPVYYSTGAGEQTSGIAVGDVNGDSLADVVVANGGYGSPFVRIFHQNDAGAL